MAGIAILGIRHDLGKAVLDTLIQHDLSATVLVDDPDYVQALYPNTPSTDLTLVKGDMDNHDAVARVCEEAEIIIPLFSLPYGDWSTTMTRWITKVADLGAGLNAKIIYPSTILPYGSVTSESNPITEEYTQQPNFEAGQLQLAFENRLISGSMEGADLTILRFPHIFGEGVLNPLMSTIFERLIAGKPPFWLGAPDRRTNFICARDAATALVRTALNTSETDITYHVAGSDGITAQQWLTDAMNLTDVHEEITVRRKWRLYFTSLLYNKWRYFYEIYPVYENPPVLDDSKFSNEFGEIEFTSFDEALPDALDWYKYWFEI